MKGLSFDLRILGLASLLYTSLEYFSGPKVEALTSDVKPV